MRRSPDSPARFIVFEGIEGSGKSTQIQLVANALRERDLDPVVTREPGGTREGEAIRAVALDRDLDIDPIAELMLMLAARSVFVRDVVSPALRSGRLLLSDRYELSTFAYQGGGRGLPLEKIREINQLATGGVRPDLSLVLDVDVADRLPRGRGPAGDRIEGADLEFHRRVASAYRELAASEPNVALVDGRLEIEGVFAAVWRVLAARFPETFGPDKC